MKRRKTTITTNKIVMSLVVLSFLVIIGKLVYVSTFENIGGVNLEIFANNRNTVTEKLYAKRGTIFDTNGDVLGESVNSYTVIAYLDSNRTTNINYPAHVIDIGETANALAPILNMDASYIESLLKKDLYQVELGPGGRGISELTKEEIEKLNLPGIDFIDGVKRFYKMGNLAPYTIGYARSNQEGKIVGEMGIENQFNDLLTGTDGYRIYERDAYGYQIPQTEVTVETPQSGNDIYLTLDSNIQLYTENAITNITRANEVDWVTITVMNGKTGKILSSASSPTFNLNELEIESYLNPLTSYTYEPGSTMKIFSYLAAMEEGIYDGDELYQSGTITVDDAVIKDHNNVGWGSISYDDGFRYSSNVATTNLALELGRDLLHNYYSLLGFGTEVGIELPGEADGDIDFQYKTEIATASFGHGITITPIQMMQALTFLTNDGNMVQPQIVDKIVDSDTNEIIQDYNIIDKGQVASSETTDHLIQLMRDVVTTKRTDAYIYEPDTINVIGKTGTAQIPGEGGYLTGTYDYIRSFAGVFPYEDPEYIIYIAVKRNQGSIMPVGDATSDLIAEIAKYMNIENSTSDITSNVYYLESFYGDKVSDVTESLIEKNITPIVLGSGEVVIEQFPMDQKVKSGDKIFLITNNNDILMPDMTDWSRSDVNTFCNLISIECEYNGYGRVFNQNFIANELIDKSLKLIVDLE